MYKVIGLSAKSINISNIGGKAYNLIKILKFYNKVPPFIVIPSFFSTKAFKSLSTTDINRIKERLDVYKIEKEIIKKIQEFFKALEVKKVILRSSFYKEDSGKKSYAGVFSSYVLEDIDDAEYLEYLIKEIWKSIWNDSVLKYSKFTINDLLTYGISVIIEEFIEPKMGGVVLGFHNDYYCEIGFDSNDKVTSGKGYDINFYYYKPKNAVMPFVYSSTTKKLENKYELLINELNNFLFHANKYFDNSTGFDVEFIYDNKDRLYIVQLRPLTFKIDLLFNREVPLSFFEIHYARNLKGFYKEIDKVFKKVGLKKIRFKKHNDSYYIKLSDLKKVYDLIGSKVKNKNFLKNIMLHFTYKMFSVRIDEFKRRVNKLRDEKLIRKSIEIIDFFNSYEFIGNLLKIFIVYPQKEIRIKIINCFNNNEYNQKFLYNIKDILKEIKAMNWEELMLYSIKFKSVVDLLFGKEYIGCLFYELQKRMKLNFNITTEYFWNIPDSYTISILKRHFVKIRVKELMEKEKKASFYKREITEIDKNIKRAFDGLIIINKKFKAKVKIINDSLEKEINKDEAMISETTNVDYIPAMMKAKAIITETGNLTCHAAVIARELNKPCIVDVRGIISYCRDGDLIKFDGKKILVYKKSRNNK